jgi:hypothetical protein
MAKKTLDQKIDALTNIVEGGFAAVAEDIAQIRKDMATNEDIAELRREMATKEQLAGLQTQTNSIERQLRETKIEIRLGNLEEKVFGQARR